MCDPIEVREPQIHRGVCVCVCVCVCVRQLTAFGCLRISHMIYAILVSANGEGNGNPLQYSCLENPLDGGAWWATVHGVTKSLTWLSD